MIWNKSTQYRTVLVIDEVEYHILAERLGDDEFYAVSINHDYIDDTDEIPTRQQLEAMIEQQQSLEDAVDEGSFIRRVS